MRSSFGGARSTFVLGAKVFSVLALCSRGEVGSVMLLSGMWQMVSWMGGSRVYNAGKDRDSVKAGNDRGLGQARGVFRWWRF
jgi:hypothetical protein